MQGFTFTAAWAQECKWQDVGATAPIRDFFQLLTENALRLYGPASPQKNLTLSTGGAALMEKLHDFFESEKMAGQQRRDTREYLSKHNQWVGSFACFDKVESDALDYASFRLEHGEDLNHRTTDPRGDPLAAPTACLCDLTPVLKKCKKVGKKGDLKNLGRNFYTCSRAEEDDACEFFRWADEPAELGPMHLSLTDLVDARFVRSYEISAESVARAGLCFAESIYYLNVIAYEIEIHSKQRQRGSRAPAGEPTPAPSSAAASVPTMLSGSAMTSVELQVQLIFSRLGSAPVLTLAGIRDKKTLQHNAVTTAQLSAKDWPIVLSLAESIEFGKIEHRRTSGNEKEAIPEAEDGGQDLVEDEAKPKLSGKKGRTQMVFLKTKYCNLSEEAKTKMKEFKIQQEAFTF